MVSVCCLTYNHEKYIRDALEGFVSQKTNFAYEVWIHDDASTDKTASIIKEYEKKYPYIIKTIYESENQYSQGVNIMKKYMYPKFSGKYVAICEGDDYWCDIHKLQKQVDFMESHIDYSACVHNTKLLDQRNGKEKLFNTSLIDMDLDFEKVIMDWGTQFHTSSVLCRKELVCVPEEMERSDIGDYPLAIYLMLMGSVRYLHEVMSVYRQWIEGSWTSRTYLNSTQQEVIALQQREIEYDERIEKYFINNNLNKKYIDCIRRHINQNWVKLIEIDRSQKDNKAFQEIYTELSIKEKVKVKYPIVVKGIRRIRILKDIFLREH